MMLQKIFTKTSKVPLGLYVLLYTEMWELFGRFGITIILVLYMTKTLLTSDQQAFDLYSSFIALTFATPILSGYLTDRFLSHKNGVILGAVLMSLGNAVMIIPKLKMLYIGLAIVVIGSGFFTASLTVLLGRMYDTNDKNRDTGFTLYHIARNIGALLAPIICGFVGERYGFNYAFLLSTIGMLSGLVVFILGQKCFEQYFETSIISSNYRDYLFYLATISTIPLMYLVLIKSLTGYLLSVTVFIALFMLAKMFLKKTGQARHNIGIIIITLLCLIIFYTFLNQGGTTLNLFIDRIVNRHIFNITIPTPFFYTLDPAFMIFVGPLIAIIFTQLAVRNYEISFITKFCLSMFILSLGFLVFVIASYQAVIKDHVNALYVVLAYFLFPIAELLIIPVSLSLITRLAPKNLVGMMVGIWMLANAISSHFTGIISQGARITFNLSDATALKKAAVIYGHLFLEATLTLAAVGITLWVLNPYIKKLLVAEKSKSPLTNDDATFVYPNLQ